MEGLAIVAVGQRDVGAVVEQSCRSVIMEALAAQVEWGFGIHVEGIHIRAWRKVGAKQNGCVFEYVCQS